MKRIVLISGKAREIKDLQSVEVKNGVPFNCPDELAEKLVGTGLYAHHKVEKETEKKEPK